MEGWSESEGEIGVKKGEAKGGVFKGLAIVWPAPRQLQIELMKLGILSTLLGVHKNINPVFLKEN